MFIKFIFQDKKRKTKTIPKTHKELQDLIAKLWGEESLSNNICYVDSDNELINIINDEDWELCLEEFQEMQQETKKSTLTLHITDSDQEITAEQIKDSEDKLKNFESQVLPESNEKAENVIPAPTNPSKLVHIRKTINEEAEDVKDVEEVEKESGEDSAEFKVIDEENSNQKPEEGQENIKKEEDEGQKNDESIFESMQNQNFNQEQTNEDQEPESIFETEEGKEGNQEPPKTEENQDQHQNPNMSTRTLPNGDVIIDYKFNTKNAQEIQDALKNFGPMMGVDILKSEIIEENPNSQQNAGGEEDEPDFESMTQRSCMTDDMRGEIEGMIEKRVQEQVNRALTKIGTDTGRTDLTQLSLESNCDSIHRYVTCDKCGTNPIKGIRYKCLVCSDFDLCEKCEFKGDHDHPMIRLRKPAPIQGHLLEKVTKKFNKYTNKNGQRNCRGWKRTNRPNHCGLRKAFGFAQGRLAGLKKGLRAAQNQNQNQNNNSPSLEQGLNHIGNAIKNMSQNNIPAQDINKVITQVGNFMKQLPERASNNANGQNVEQLINQVGSFINTLPEQAQQEGHPLNFLASHVQNFAQNLQKRENPEENNCSEPSQPTQETQESNNSTRRSRGPGLVHIRRSRQEEPKPEDQAQTETQASPEIIPHSRLSQFIEIFPQIDRNLANQFLYENDGINDETELFNLFINKFINEQN